MSRALPIVVLALVGGLAAAPPNEQQQRMLRVDPVLANEAERAAGARDFLRVAHDAYQLVGLLDGLTIQAKEAKTGGTPPSHRPTRPTAVNLGTGRCGGDLPPCYVMERESHGNIRAQNPNSSASGKWQILDSTWAGFGGYARAADAPEAVQDERARQLAPCNWQPPNYCGR